MKHYLFGFNGKENDYEAKGWMNQQDYGMRIYDTRLGRFLSVDPISPDYPELTPYQFASNMPIWAIDLDGLEAVDFQSAKLKKKEYDSDIPWYFQPEVFKQNSAVSAVNSLIQTGEDITNVIVSTEGRNQVAQNYGFGLLSAYNSYNSLLHNVTLGNFRQIGNDMKGFLSDPNNVEDLYGNFVAGVLLSKLPVKSGLSAAFNKIKSSAIFRSTKITTSYNGLKFVPKKTSYSSFGSEMLDDGLRLNEQPLVYQQPDLIGFRKEHILNRHKSGAGLSGKTEFPASWNDNKILNAINEVANNPNATGGFGKWRSPFKIGTVDGIKIRVDFYPESHPTHSGMVSTGYPINVPANP